MGELDLWDSISPDDHSAVFDIFTEESKLIGERCRSGKATTKEKSTLTKFLVELGALQITVQRGEDNGSLPSSVKISIPKKQERLSVSAAQPDKTESSLNLGSGEEMLTELTAGSDQLPESSAGDNDDSDDDDCGDDVDNADDDDDGNDTNDEVPVWMRDPPDEHQTNKTIVEPQKERHECSNCQTVLFCTLWEFDLHYLECVKPQQTKCKPSVSFTRCQCDLCNTVVRRRDLLVHYSKVHSLSFEEAVKKIPGFRLSMSKYVRSSAHKKPKKLKFSRPFAKCVFCDVVLNRRSMIMHIYKMHGLSYQEAVKKIPGYKVNPNNRGPGSAKHSKKSTDVEGIPKGKAKKQQKQQRADVNSKRRKTKQPWNSGTSGEPISSRIPLKKLVIKLEKIENKLLQRVTNEENSEENPECSDMREIGGEEKVSPSSPTANENKDTDCTVSQRETEDKDIGVVGVSGGKRHACDSNQEMKERVDSAFDKQAVDNATGREPTAVQNDELDVSVDTSGGRDLNLDKENVIGGEEESTGPVEEEAPFACDICGERFNLQSRFRDHMVTEHFQCTTCGRMYKNGLRLKVHLKHHKKEAAGVSYACSHCPKSFVEQKAYGQHMRLQHSTKDWECEFCQRKFKNNRTLRMHMRYMHAQGDKLACNYCEAVYSTNYELNRHVSQAHAKEKEKKWKCDECGKTFFSQSTRNQHRRSVHIASREHLCEICGSTYKTKKNLEDHQTIHADIFKFTCEICGKQFKRESVLNIHLALHSDRMPFECEQCGKRFKRAQNLQIHRDSHSGVRRFACDLCPKKFKHKATLYTHLKKHSTAPRYLCDSCGDDFPNFSRLKNHLLIVHCINIMNHINSTDSAQESSAQAKAQSLTGTPPEHHASSGIADKDEPQPSTANTEHQTGSIAESVPVAEVVVECRTQESDHSSAVIAVPTGASEDYVNQLVTEALVAVLQAHSIQ